MAPLVALLAGKAVQGKVASYSTASTHKEPAEGKDKEEKTGWIEIKLIDEDNDPVTSERYRVELPYGKIAGGALDQKGMGRVQDFKPGSCKVTFPNLDKDA